MGHLCEPHPLGSAGPPKMAGIDGASSFPGDEGDTVRGKERTSSTGQLAGLDMYSSQVENSTP